MKLFCPLYPRPKVRGFMALGNNAEGEV